MQIPEELNKLLGQFDADLDLLHDSIESVVRATLPHLSRDEQKVVKQFLTRLLSEDYDIQELHRLWWASPADTIPEPKAIPYVLGLIRDMIVDTQP